MAKSKQQRIEELEDQLEAIDESWLKTIDSWIVGRHAQDTVAAILYFQDEAGKDRGSAARDARMFYDPYATKLDFYGTVSYGYERASSATPQSVQEAMSLFGRFVQTDPRAAQVYMNRALVILNGVSAAIDDASLKAII
jgi:hypothetical protein